MHTEIEVINAARAKEYLERNPSFTYGAGDTNRPISISVVNNYAAAMLRGEWRLTHQGLAFTSSGRLLDGQHRLQAIIQAAETGANGLPPKEDLAIEFSVTRDVDQDVFDVLDIHRIRGANQILAMSGMTNTTVLAASARLLYLYDNHPFKQWNKIKVSNHQINELVHHNELVQFMGTASALRPIGLMMSAGLVGLFVTYRAYPEGPHEQFQEALRHGVGLEVNDPRLVLRNYLIRSKSIAGYRRDSFAHLAIFIKTWNDYVLGRKRNAISFRSGEEMPRPVTK